MEQWNNVGFQYQHHLHANFVSVRKMSIANGTLGSRSFQGGGGGEQGGPDDASKKKRNSMDCSMSTLLQPSESRSSPHSLFVLYPLTVPLVIILESSFHI